jgi:hypothetical protein
MNTADKIYLVQYDGGSYEDSFEATVFATTKKSTATKYVTKFNRILKKWKQYYSQYEDKTLGISWITDEYAKKYFNRWYSLRRINKCYYHEVEVR